QVVLAGAMAKPVIDPARAPLRLELADGASGVVLLRIEGEHRAARVEIPVGPTDNDHLHIRLVRFDSASRILIASHEDVFDVLVDLHPTRGRPLRFSALLDAGNRWMSEFEDDFTLEGIMRCGAWLADAIFPCVSPNLGAGTVRRWRDLVPQHRVSRFFGWDLLGPALLARLEKHPDTISIPALAVEAGSDGSRTLWITGEAALARSRVLGTETRCFRSLWAKICAGTLAPAD